MSKKIDKKSRLICIQGTSQLLNVLGILNYQKHEEKFVDYEDHLILGGFYMSFSKAKRQEMISACLKIAKYWQFKSHCYLPDEDFSGAFSQQINAVRRRINLEDVDYIYVCRNWQDFNEVLLASYHDAIRICYGDGFGSLDLRDHTHQVRSANPKGYFFFNKSYLFIPTEESHRTSDGSPFSLTDEIVQPSIDYLIKTIIEVESLIPEIKDEISQITSLDQHTYQRQVLVLISTFTESGFIQKNSKLHLYFFFELPCKILLKLIIFCRVSLVFLGIKPFRYLLRLIEIIQSLSVFFDVRLEIHLYLEQIQRICEKEDLIILKSHPRESLSKTFLLASQLSQRGYIVNVINEKRSVFPIELFPHHMDLSKIITFGSNSTIGIVLMSGLKREQVFYYIDQDILERFFKKQHLEEYKNIYKFLEIRIKQACDRKFSPLTLKT